jgi:uncharacterized protein (DUF2252 family)
MSTVLGPPDAPPTRAERVNRGKDARKQAPRSGHGGWVPDGARPDPVATLEAQAATRLLDLVPIRYGRMLLSPFSFFRGAAAIMAADLAGTPDSGITVQLCGDAHASNFGVYAAPDRRLVFDLNDFDETLPGPWEWDVKRLVASLEVAGRDRGWTPRQRASVVLAAAREYRDAMRRFASMGHLRVWYARLDVGEFLDAVDRRVPADTLSAARRATARARAKTSLRAVTKLTERVDGRVRFVSAPPLLVRLEDVLKDAAADDREAGIGELLALYRASLGPEVAYLVAGYRPVDMARKVVGVGSVGLRAWIILLAGVDERDPLVLQAKEAQPSVLEQHVGPSEFGNHGERVVHGQRFMQAASDVLLGWQSTTGLDGLERDFYVRQLWDGKGSVDVATISAGRMSVYARLCGWTLARAHARSGDRVAIAAYLGKGDVFDRAMLEFARTYADQNQRDFRTLERAVDNSRVAATLGV